MSSGLSGSNNLLLLSLSFTRWTYWLIVFGFSNVDARRMGVWSGGTMNLLMGSNGSIMMAVDGGMARAAVFGWGGKGPVWE